MEGQAHLAVVRGGDDGVDNLLLRVRDVRHRVRVDELLLVREELDHRRRELRHGPEGERREASRLRRILQGVSLLFFGRRLWKSTGVCAACAARWQSARIKIHYRADRHDNGTVVVVAGKLRDFFERRHGVGTWAAFLVLLGSNRFSVRGCQS